MSVFPIKTLEHGGHHTQAALFTATAWAHSKQGLCGEGIPRRLHEHFKYLLQHFCCWNRMWVKTTLSNSKSTGDLWNREGGSCERYQVSIKLIFFLIQPGSVRCHGQLIRVAAQFNLSVQSKRYYPVRVCVPVCVCGRGSSTEYIKCMDFHLVANLCFQSLQNFLKRVLKTSTRSNAWVYVLWSDCAIWICGRGSQKVESWHWGRLSTAKPLIYSGHLEPIIILGEESSGGCVVSSV